MTVTAEHVLSIAREYIGVVEATGRNDGAAVHAIQATTGAYNAPWCASFVQTVLKRSGVGTIADDSAGVFYIRDWCKAHGYLPVAAPAPGRLAIYQAGEGHIGIVEKALDYGAFQAIEGNHDNAVQRVVRVKGELNVVFAQLPGIVAVPPKIQPPYEDWKAWKLGIGRFKAYGPASARVRPGTWLPAVPHGYFTHLSHDLAGNRAALRKPEVAPVPEKKSPRFMRRSK